MRHLALLAILVTSPWPAIAQAAREPLVGTVVSPDGKPIANVTVEAWRAEGRGLDGLDLAYKRGWKRIGRAQTNKHGRFFLRLPRGLPSQIRIDLPPYARYVRDSVLPGEGMRVKLETPAVLRGRIADQAGNGVRAGLRLWRKQEPMTEVLLARTENDGSFRFARLPPGTFCIEVTPDHGIRPAWTKLELVAGQATEHNVTIEPGVRIIGTVRDRATGKPIAGAEVGDGWLYAVRTDANGRYSYPYGSGLGSHEVHCRARGYVKKVAETAKRTTLAAVPSRNLTGDFTLDFQLEHGLRAEGRVEDPTGKPARGVYVAVVGTVNNGPTEAYEWIPTRTDDEGRFQVSGLSPDQSHVVLVKRDGWATLAYHLPAADKNGVHHIGALRMREPRLLTGRVLNRDHKPVAGIEVLLLGTNADRFRLNPGAAKAAGKAEGCVPEGLDDVGRWWLLYSLVARHRVYTDDHGRFAFGDLAPGSYGIFAAGKIPIEYPTNAMEVTANADPDPIDVTIDR